MPAERGPARPVRGGRPEGSKLGGDDGRILAEPPLLFDRKALARALGVSVRHLDGMRSRGALPLGVRIGGGRIVRWPRGTIERWIAAGMPSGERFEELERGREGRP